MKQRITSYVEVSVYNELMKIVNEGAYENLSSAVNEVLGAYIELENNAEVQKMIRLGKYANTIDFMKHAMNWYEDTKDMDLTEDMDDTDIETDEDTENIDDIDEDEPQYMTKEEEQKYIEYADELIDYDVLPLGITIDPELEMFDNLMSYDTDFIQLVVDAIELDRYEEDTKLDLVYRLVEEVEEETIEYFIKLIADYPNIEDEYADAEEDDEDMDDEEDLEEDNDEEELEDEDSSVYVAVDEYDDPRLLYEDDTMMVKIVDSKKVVLSFESNHIDNFAKICSRHTNSTNIVNDILKVTGTTRGISSIMNNYLTAIKETSEPVQSIPNASDQFPENSVGGRKPLRRMIRSAA